MGVNLGIFRRLTSAFLLAIVLGQYAAADGQLDVLQRAAPQLEVRALQEALQALRCAERGGIGKARRLAVIDYSRSSLERRMWVFDLAQRRLLQREFVAHGRQSGELFAERFSNLPGSHQSSLGLFRGAESYTGRHGHSLRLDGLEPGFNDEARARALVIHGADYVAPAWAEKHGRMGRSLGCPAVQQEVIRVLVDQLKDGQYLFAWHPQMKAGRYLDCASVSAVRSVE
ncbi:Uncharacterised protein [Ectopseudomonas mendocina]|uniref:murein L,D-transpeptidase catalytic domain family protein n=1 Tax=Ectopseudomonas mendocina TaxID=300 RepID=UPI000DFA825A|nr:Uncharacterised protein [Pseudomonas mendocina]